MKCLLIFAILALLIPSIICKKYTKCELARELYRLGLPKAQLPDWICLIKAESSFDTTLVNVNKDKKTNKILSKDYGLFQFNDHVWCDVASKASCGTSCQNYLNDNIADDVACAKKVYAERNNFSAWEGWKKSCKGTKPGVSECF